MFLVTRPQAKANETVAALKAEGFEALALPVMLIEPLLNITPSNLSPYKILVVTSTYTEHFLKTHLPCLISYKSTIVCVGDATAQMLKKLLQAHQLTANIEIAEPQNSEGILASPVFSVTREHNVEDELAHMTVGVVKGTEGRDLIANFLEETEIKHEVYEVYQRKSAIEASNLKQLDVTLVTCVVVTSVEVAQHIFKYFPVTWPQDSVFMVASKRIESFVKTQGAITTVVCAGASTNAIVSCAKELRQKLTSIGSLR